MGGRAVFADALRRFDAHRGTGLVVRRNTAMLWHHETGFHHGSKPGHRPGPGRRAGESRRVRLRRSAQAGHGDANWTGCGNITRACCRSFRWMSRATNPCADARTRLKRHRYARYPGQQCRSLPGGDGYAVGGAGCGWVRGNRGRQRRRRGAGHPGVSAGARRGGKAARINISSGAGSIGDKTDHQFYCYGASKAALNHFTVGLAHELRPRGVIVVAISPGWVRTDMGGAGGELSPRGIRQRDRRYDSETGTRRQRLLSRSLRAQGQVRLVALRRTETKTPHTESSRLPAP
jgi:hypothetical protein